MATGLPATRPDWKKAIKAGNIRIGPLSSADSFQSGSKFSMNDFLRLRIIHQSQLDPSYLYEHYLPKKSVTRITKVFNKNVEIQTLRQLLSDSKKIESWNVEDASKAARFAVGLEHLYVIVSTPPKPRDPEDETGQDTDLSKITNSPQVARELRKPDKGNIDLSGKISKLNLKRPQDVQPQTPQNKSIFSTGEEYDDTPLAFRSASTTISIPSPMNQDLSQAVESHKREMFQLTGDEQTVNACLVDLLIPIASILGSRGRVRFDRESFQVLKRDATDGKALFEACVDGLIMNEDGKTIQAFMEVKRELRSLKKNVRMQEGAQMAAFVYSQGKTGKESRYEVFCFPSCFARHANNSSA
ncbi:hypothetical protein OEA41_000897 [Lepraria neglecta]|uniref:Uncharacterized protein n=1 Tax=Lepraria neglecta TaxID=209136 RepID=A0AAD9ZGW8_9LECA|nr:hypothetical protein OEA41_000897 [Lepraria neglecta]